MKMVLVNGDLARKMHTIYYKYDANRKSLPALAGIASDAKISNLGDTYKGEVDFL